jgi:hypothetical protein
MDHDLWAMNYQGQSFLSACFVLVASYIEPEKTAADGGRPSPSCKIRMASGQYESKGV